MYVKSSTEQIYHQFVQRLNKNRPLVVGIDGLGGAGKSTFSYELKDALVNYNCSVHTIHLDHHIVERKNRYQTIYEEWYEYYYLQWDVIRIVNDLLKPLQKGLSPLLPFYHPSTDSISSEIVKVCQNSIVLIEGIFLQREEWRAFFDIVIFLDCPEEVRHDRVLKRDTYLGDYETRLKKYQERYWLGEKHYMENVDPYRLADVIVYT